MPLSRWRVIIALSVLALLLVGWAQPSAAACRYDHPICADHPDRCKAIMAPCGLTVPAMKVDDGGIPHPGEARCAGVRPELPILAGRNAQPDPGTLVGGRYSIERAALGYPRTRFAMRDISLNSGWTITPG